MPFLDVADMIINYGKVNVINNVSFSVERGEILGLAGCNGCGKTTLIKALVGLIKPSAGKVLIKGNLLDPSVYHKFIGYCPQENSFFEKLTTRENIEYFGHLYKIGKDELNIHTAKIAYSLGLKNKLNKLAGTLSGGQKRRLNIACSIVHLPEMLIMDEPSLALDPAARYNLWTFIKALNKNGTTIVLSSNSMEELSMLCDSIVAIKGGRVAFHGSAKNLRRNSVFQNLFEGGNDAPD